MLTPNQISKIDQDYVLVKNNSTEVADFGNNLKSQKYLGNQFDDEVDNLVNTSCAAIIELPATLG